jgi:error-prone DNA polymerase
MLPDYAELHCLSNFSFLRGASHAKELVVRAQCAGLPVHWRSPMNVR